ncbi:hypothetical protein HPB51_002223 [Rhipicephalus microplus]|uniref:Tick transposon n=1 Tax=Rhipicephalus microplus TaxID=6941 RepID=A0A9J6E5V8_RHIMP|nr:hypothetical protein HPB51_002223 [Rhipicephalus microplus]
MRQVIYHEYGVLIRQVKILEGLRDKDSALAELNKQIADVLDGEEFGEEVAGTFVYQEKIVKAISRLRSAMNALQSRPRAPSLRSALPKLRVSIFTSENREWQWFWEHYKATIHKHPDITSIKKLKYLKTYLFGTAKWAIEGIRLTEANYSIAVKVLTERFCRKDVLIEDHIDSLLAIEPIKKSSHVSR